MSGCPVLLLQALDQTSDPVSGLSSIQLVKRKGSQSVVVQLRLGVSNYISGSRRIPTAAMSACILTLKKEATKPAASNFLQQQVRFDKFIEVFNNGVLRRPWT